MSNTIWLTPKEAAAFVRLDVATLRRAVKRGELVAFRVNGGHRLRFRASDIDKWLEAHSTKEASS